MTPTVTYTLPLRTGAPSPLDLRWQDVFPLTGDLPDRVDLSAWLGPVRNQNLAQLGECTAESGVGAVEWLYARYRNQRRNLSSTFLYEVERQLGGELPEDAGARLRQTQVALQTVGVCDDALDPDVRQDFLVPITPALLANAAQHKISHGYWCPSLAEILHVLANPVPTVVQLGIVVYPSFETAPHGRVPLPQPTEQPLGGHAVLVYGYEAAQRVLLVRNSWGQQWGDDGNFTLPWAYLDNPQWFLSARAYYLDELPATA